MRSIKNWKYSDTDAHTFTTELPDTIQVVLDTKFHTLTDKKEGAARDEGTNKIADTTAGNAMTVLAGTVLYGQFSTITLHSGYVIAHRTTEE